MSAGSDGAVQRGNAKEVGARIQRLRTERGLTQRQLAEPEYTAAYVSTVEAGKVRASETALRYLASRLDTSYEQLAVGLPAGLRTELREGIAEAIGLLDGGSDGQVEPLLHDLLQRAERHGLADLESDLRVALGTSLLRRGALAQGRAQFEQAQALLADQPLPRRVRAIRGQATTHQLGDVRYACYLLEKTINELNGGGLPDPGRCCCSTPRSSPRTWTWARTSGRPGPPSSRWTSHPRCPTRWRWRDCTARWPAPSPRADSSTRPRPT